MTRHAARTVDGCFAGYVRPRSRRSRDRACACGRSAWQLCDGRAPGRIACDVPLCDACAHGVGGDLHFCAACRLRAADPVPGALIAYTDGSGTLAHRPCGAGVVVYDGDAVVIEASRHLGLGTNNHAELSGVRVALDITATHADRPLVVRSDSMYAIGALAGEPPHARAPNAHLIFATRRLMAGRAVYFEHVPGHAGLAGNVRADELASRGRLNAPKPGAPASGRAAGGEEGAVAP